MAYTVAQNTSFYTAASVLQKVISFVYFVFIARLVGVENTGQYFFAITFTTIFTVVADFGLAPVLTREISRSPEKTESYINTIFWTKILFGLLAYLIIAVLVNILKYPVLTKDLIYLSGITMFFDNLHSAFYSIFRARKNLVFESAGIVGSQLLTLIIGTLALYLRWPLIWLIAAYTIPSFLNFLYVLISVKTVYSLSYQFVWDKKIFKLFIVLAFPFALAGIISRLYAYSDSLLMSKMLTKQELGWWSVPYKITFAFQFIPAALAASVYPVFSSLFLTDKQKISELFEKSWKYLFIIIFPLALGLIAVAKPVIALVYTESYLPSVEPLRILLASLIFGFLSIIIGSVLNAINKQKIQTGLLALALVVNVILNIILLPSLRIVGAAVAALASNFILWIVGLYLVDKQIILNKMHLFKYFLQTFFPALVMSIMVYFLLFKIHVFISIVIGVILYVIFIFLSGAININLIKAAFNKVKGARNSYE